MTRDPPKRDTAQPSGRSVGPQTTGRFGNHPNSNDPSVADRKAKAIARDRRLLDKCLKLLSDDSGRRLARQFAPGHIRWTITPLGIPVSGRIAERAIACQHVVVEDPGLFPGADVAQTFRLRPVERIVSGKGRARLGKANDGD
jgi:hypothetical protein